MDITRRKLIIGIFSAVGVATAYLSGRVLRIKKNKSDNPKAIGNEILFSTTSLLSKRDKSILWELFLELGALWKMSAVTRSQFESILEMKTQQSPSYFEEYQNAINIYRKLLKKHSPANALHYLLKGNQGRTPKKWSLEDHARIYVINEFINFHVRFGGFKKLQLEMAKYPGFASGPTGYLKSRFEPSFTDNVNLVRPFSAYDSK